MPLKKFKAHLLPEIRELNVTTKKNLLSNALSGELTSMLKGRGVEFEDYRDYTVTDDASRIDWRASKRSQRVLVREYKLEINLNVLFMVDTSESMLFSSNPKLKCEYAAEVVTSLLYGILEAGNSAGFGLFNDTLYKMMKPSLGRRQFHIFIKEITNPKNYGGKKNLAKALQQALALLDTKTLMFIVSDFITDSEDWIEFLKIISKKHEAVGVVIRDPRDNSLPKDAGQLILGDPFSPESIYIDAAQYAKIYEEYSNKQRRLIDAAFKSNMSGMIELTTDKPFINPVLEFFRRRGGTWK